MTGWNPEDPLRAAIYAVEGELRGRGLVRLLPGHGELLLHHPELGHLFTRGETAARAKDPTVRGRAAVWPDGYQLTGEWWAPPWVAGLLRFLRPNTGDATGSPEVELPEVERVLLTAMRSTATRDAMEATARVLRWNPEGGSNLPALQAALVAMAGVEVEGP